jgi:hemoglobin
MRTRIRAIIAAAAASAFALGNLTWASDQTGPSNAVSDSNAGATPIAGHDVFNAFHGQAGVTRIVTILLVTVRFDPRIASYYQGKDFARLNQMLTDQLCYILGGPCQYTGQDMRSAHADLGVRAQDFKAMIQDLQAAMHRERVPYWAQNKLLDKLNAMQQQIVTK